MRIDSIAARQRLVDDRHYKYRGCAPDEDNPRMSAGDPDVPVDAWGPYTDDGAEAQKVRLDREEAAIGVCQRCPVMLLCRTYGNTTVLRDGLEHLVEPEGILGGELALTRHRELIKRRHALTVGEASAPAEPAPVRDLDEARTDQKLAVLAALVRETDPEAVAYRAGMNLRTANWHRSALVTMLGMDREHATRDQLLAAAAEAGLLAAAVKGGFLPRWVKVRPDGPMPYAAAPTVDGVRQRRIAPPSRTVGPQLVLPGMEDMPRGPRRLAGPAQPDPARRNITGRELATLVKPHRTFRARIRSAFEQLQLRLTPTAAPAAVPALPAPAAGPPRTRPVRTPRPRTTTTPTTVLEPAA
ncbi:hypothetical protein [Streptomyces sp. NBC_01422]|uniref:hypothetical protein n=1 Tax=Streptomyces sp. NBC_01422 TaxID=2903859 RepID=UPI002E29B48A|nr:hypothetical protein [Streptomyces sp. NBC_01422]